MTLVWGSHGALQQLQLGFNEVASALVIGKIVGSVFTRRPDAEIFSVMEKEYEVRVKAIPKWMQNFQFPRTGVIHGQGMRRLECSNLMDDVDGHSLQGFATMIVLCCRYAEPVESIVSVLNDFIVLGHDLIYPGRLGDYGTRLSYAEKSLVSNFVRATIDTDANSQQAANVISWMAELSREVGVSTRLNFAAGRASNYNRTLISRLTGNLTPIGVRVKGGGTADDLDDDLVREPSQIVHHTLSMGTASIALAAAANGADVSLQCITSKGIKTIPKRSVPAAFVVRLWLRQPPPQISNFLSYAEAKDKGTMAGSMGGSDACPVVVFGGNQEIALNVAREIGYGAKELECGEGSRMWQRVQNLWSNGRQKGKELRWLTSSSSQLRFGLNAGSDLPPIPPYVEPLLDMLDSIDNRLSSIGRILALIVDDIYRYSEYPPDQAVEFSTAMILVSVAMAIGGLHSLTRAPANDKDQFAVEIGSVRRNGPLRELLPLALNGQGITHEVLLWTAATLWGGASSESQGGFVMDRRAVGIVAPHCTMILDILRDPIEFARPPMAGNLLTMCRGSMPLLARNPRSGFMTAADLGHRSRGLLDCRQNALSCASLPESLHDQVERIAGDPGYNELIITLEPETHSGPVGRT